MGARAAAERVTDCVRAGGTAGPYQADAGGCGFRRRGSPMRGSAGLRKLASPRGRACATTDFTALVHSLETLATRNISEFLNRF